MQKWKFEEENKKIGNSIFNREKMLKIFGWHFEIEERSKGVHCVDLGESSPKSIYLQKSASIQPKSRPLEVWEKIMQYYSFVYLAWATDNLTNNLIQLPVVQRQRFLHSVKLIC